MHPRLDTGNETNHGPVGGPFVPDGHPIPGYSWPENPKKMAHDYGGHPLAPYLIEHIQRLEMAYALLKDFGVDVPPPYESGSYETKMGVSNDPNSPNG